MREQLNYLSNYFSVFHFSMQLFKREENLDHLDSIFHMNLMILI